MPRAAMATFCPKMCSVRPDMKGSIRGLQPYAVRRRGNESILRRHCRSPFRCFVEWRRGHIKSHLAGRTSINNPSESATIGKLVESKILGYGLSRHVLYVYPVISGDRLGNFVCNTVKENEYDLLDLFTPQTIQALVGHFGYRQDWEM
jgi:hypothetical protein